MRRIVVAVMGTVSGLVMLFSYHTSTNSEAAPATAAADSGTGTGTTSGSSSSSSSTTAPDSSSSSSSTPSSSSSSSSSSAAKSSGTYTGEAVDTRWGPVQVKITVQNGTITKAEAVEYPQNNPRDQEINAYAVPALDDEVVKAQSASIDAVSGATVTSGGYLTSLQSAIDKANL